MENDIIILIDASTRDLMVSTCAVTQLQTGRLVLRKAAEIGRLHDIVKPESNFCPEMPILIIGSYSAQSSNGFAKTITAKRTNCIIGGGIGFGGFRTDDLVIRGDSLRPFKLGGYMIPAGEIIQQIRTGDTNSNSATANAAMLGLQISADMTDDIIIAEGQTDYVSAWRITNPPSTTIRLERMEFPSEHREDIFAEKPEFVPCVDSDPGAIQEAICETIETTRVEYTERVKDGCTEHRHPGSEHMDYWHPVSRVHKEGVA